MLFEFLYFGFLDPPSSHVSFEIYSLPRGEFTLSAIEGLFFRVCQHVCCELASLLAGVVTLSAIERLFFRM